MRKYLNRLLAYFGYLHVDEVNTILTGELLPLKNELAEFTVSVANLSDANDTLLEALLDIREHQNKTGKSEGYAAKRALTALNSIK